MKEGSLMRFLFCWGSKQKLQDIILEEAKQIQTINTNNICFAQEFIFDLNT